MVISVRRMLAAVVLSLVVAVGLGACRSPGTSEPPGASQPASVPSGESSGPSEAVLPTPTLEVPPDPY